MRKLVATLLLLMLAAGLVLAAGCGGGEKTESGDVVVTDVPEPASQGIDGEYESSDGKKVSLYKDGTFTTGTGNEGAYEVDGSSLKLEYDGKSETWSIMVSGGEIAAIVDSDGTQYTKTGK